MKRINWRAAFLTILFSWVTILSLPVQAGPNQSDPVGLLRYIADNMIAQLKARKATLKTNPQVVYQLANQYVVPYANLPEMSKRVIPPQVWNNATPAQRAQFQKQFTRLLVRTYASALSSYQDESVEFYPVRGGYAGSNTVEVNSTITGGSHDPISVVYRLVRIGNVWRLYDMSVEGVSLIESFRSQFADILSQGDMEMLLKRMSQHGASRS